MFFEIIKSGAFIRKLRIFFGIEFRLFFVDIDKPENESLIVNTTSNAIVAGEPVKLTCKSSAKPENCQVLLYQGDQLLVNKTTTTCTQSYTMNIQGCNLETFWCVTRNLAGTSQRAYHNFTVQGTAEDT